MAEIAIIKFSLFIRQQGGTGIVLAHSLNRFGLKSC